MTFTKLRENEEPPNKPGVYAFRLTKADALKPIRLEDSEPLYIGKAETSLRKRNHLEYKNSGSFTFRRSLGALLKDDEWQLKTIPRGSGQSEGDVTNFRFSNDDEERLTAWMRDKLEYSFEVVTGDVKERERRLISQFHPPLNLTNLGEWRNPQKGLVMGRREACRREAESAANTQAGHTASPPRRTLRSERKPNSLIVAGVMSGTSADGVDVAICRIAPARAKNASPRIQFLGHAGFPYPRAVRGELLRIMEGPPLPAAEFSRLNWRLGALYADCVEKAAAKFSLKPALIGLHGQTIHHEPKATKFLGTRVRSTWQIGEAAVIAERLRCPVVSDLRPADLAAGGQGAPLVPMLDWCLFRHPTRNRILLNLGGIANLTVIPAGASIDSLLAFDTGPGNMVIDALMRSEFSKPFDRNGRIAAQGSVLGDLFTQLWRDPYFAAPPPKSCGREQFGLAFAQRLKKLAPKAAPADLVATATYLTATSVLEAISSFCLPHLAQHAPRAITTDLIAAGGGTRNRTLMSLLAEGLDDLNISLLPTDSLGIPSQAKEAVAFALLAWLTWFGLPGNVPAATGSSRPIILGKVSRP